MRISFDHTKAKMLKEATSKTSDTSTLQLMVANSQYPEARNSIWREAHSDKEGLAMQPDLCLCKKQDQETWAGEDNSPLGNALLQGEDNAH